MKIIGIYNIKGGVGKTAASVNLAHLASNDGFQTLLWDLDPQGSSTYYLHKKQGVSSSLKKIISGKAEMNDMIKKTDYPCLHLLPSDFSFRNMDVALDDVKKSKKRISDILHGISDYDFIFLDSPPGISLLSENIFRASDYLLVPTVPTPLSGRTLEQIKSFFKENELDEKKIIPFYSMAETRKKIHSETMEAGMKDIPGMCKNFIPYLSDIEKMGVYREPVTARRPKSRGSEAYKKLWEEIKSKVI